MYNDYDLMMGLTSFSVIGFVVSIAVVGLLGWLVSRGK